MNDRMFLADAMEEADKSIKNRSKHKLAGLSAGKRFTCWLLGTEEIFWAESGIPEDRYKALFNWMKSDEDFSFKYWFVMIEHEGIYKDGYPRNPTVVEVILEEP
jgi:hypothetical protein